MQDAKTIERPNRQNNQTRLLALFEEKLSTQHVRNAIYKPDPGVLHKNCSRLLASSNWVGEDGAWSGLKLEPLERNVGVYNCQVPLLSKCSKECFLDAQTCYDEHNVLTPG